MDVSFDLWYSESDAYNYIPKVEEYLDNKGLLEESNGAKVVFINKDTDKIKVVTTIFPEYDWVREVAGKDAGNLDCTMLLDNGVLVLASGRPGIQLRFCLDGTGENWTDPIDMMHFMNEDGTQDIYASCGYAALMPISRNSFYLVYSDFHEKNKNGEDRKAIKLRKIKISKR